ncbi:MAG: anti-sigma factor [Gemmatimonadetes bacterium]|nr:anti-sigma factor [Gemmatimonadota bacterium]
MSDELRARIDELLIDRATDAPDPERDEELLELLERVADTDFELYERVAAEITAALLPVQGLDPMPAHVESAVLSSAPGASVHDIRRGSRAVGPDWTRRAGWAVAAAALVIWLTLPRGSDPIVEPTTAEVRSALAEGAVGTLELPWTSTEDAAAVDASGDVVWSTTAQDGVMRFAGLQPNDPTEFQYQLWIFDGTRDDRYPVDGGVFDVPAGAGDVLVRIRPKIEVREPVLFAITIEAPGGVVVSARERIVLVAETG